MWEIIYYMQRNSFSHRFNLIYLRTKYSWKMVISWSTFHNLYENELKLEANLNKAHKITFQVTDPGNSMQNVSHALAIFHETTSAAILSYYLERDEASAFLQLFNKLFFICNSKQQFHSPNIKFAITTSQKKKGRYDHGV